MAIPGPVNSAHPVGLDLFVINLVLVTTELAMMV